MKQKQDLRYNPTTMCFEKAVSDGIAESKTVEKKEPSDKSFHRTMFQTSRMLEYFTERELMYQTGHPKSHWPYVILKELMDNAMDACENASIAPKIKVELYDAGSAFEIAQQFVIVVEDNGPGIDPEVVTKILNFATRTSDKEAYVSPTRGAQGNALKTVFAIPYVLSASTPLQGICQIESKGVKHIIKIKLDAIKQEPIIDHKQKEIVKKSGCRVVVWLKKSSIPESFSEGEFLQILRDYHLFNPHLTLSVEVGSTKLEYEATDPSWQKWRPNDFTSPLWYSTEDLKKLVLSHVALVQDGARNLTLREFVAQFRGITSTAKQKAVTANFPAIKRLSDFVSDEDVDSSRIESLLTAMKSVTKPVPPRLLGIIGEEHFKKVFKTDNIKYSKKVGGERKLPFVTEVAYIPDTTLERVVFHFGLNFAPAGSDPLQGYMLLYETKREDFQGSGVKGLAREFKVDLTDQIHIVCHITYPRLRFKDRGKTILEIENG